MNNYDLIVKSAFGIEAITKRELMNLGISNPKAYNGSILINGDWSTITKLNLNLRTADRVLIKITEGKALSFDELYDLITNSDIDKFISKRGNIIIKAKSVKSILHSLSAIQSISKKAIVNKIMNAYNLNSLEEDQETYIVDVSIVKDIVTLSLDTTGSGLHKRGYREMVWKAPLKETTAAAMVLLSVYNPGKEMIDPFCGSGTIPIEAAMIAYNIPTGLNRDFLYEKWNIADKNAQKLAKEEALDNINYDVPIAIRGSDIDPKAIELAQYHAERAGVSVDFELKDCKDITAYTKYGVIISNPPYGERLLSDDELKVTYKNLYTAYKGLDDWSMYILSGCESFEQYLGKKADKNRKLYNAQIECRLYTYLGNYPK